MSDQEFAQYLDSARITGNVATPRENNLDHIQGFLDHNEHLEFGVQYKRDYTWDEVFEIMVRRAGLNPDRNHTHGQDTIGATQCIQQLREYARIFGQAVRERKRILFATGHPAGLFPIYAQMARVARAAGATVLEIEQGERFLDGDIRQIFSVVMFEQYGNLQHTHFPGPMQIALNQLRERDELPELVVSDHGMAGYASSTAGLLTIGIADCNDPGLFVAAEQGDLPVCVPMDDNVPPNRYEPVIDFILSEAGLEQYR